MYMAKTLLINERNWLLGNFSDVPFILLGTLESTISYNLQKPEKSFTVRDGSGKIR